MFTLKTKHELQTALTRAIEELDTYSPMSDEYGKALDRIEKLHKMISQDRPKPFDSTAVLAIAANLIGIWRMTQYEKTHVITSKALGFVIKPRT